MKMKVVGLVKAPCTSLLMHIAICLSLSGCVVGIPPADGWTPPKLKPCHVVVTQAGARACMTRWEFNEWRRLNGV